MAINKWKDRIMSLPSQKCRSILPFSNEALPPAFHLLSQILDENVLLNIEVEREHGWVGGEIMAGKAASLEW
jgi:hypothetical protein